MFGVRAKEGEQQLEETLVLVKTLCVVFLHHREEILVYLSLDLDDLLIVSSRDTEDSIRHNLSPFLGYAFSFVRQPYWEPCHDLEEDYS